MAIIARVSTVATTARIQSGTLRELRSPIVPLGRPAPFRFGSRCDLVQRAPAFIRGRARLFDGAPQVAQLPDEIVELRVNLGTGASASFGEIHPAPHTTRDRASQCREQYTRSFLHVA